MVDLGMFIDLMFASFETKLWFERSYFSEYYGLESTFVFRTLFADYCQESYLLKIDNLLLELMNFANWSNIYRIEVRVFVVILDIKLIFRDH